MTVYIVETAGVQEMETPRNSRVNHELKYSCRQERTGDVVAYARTLLTFTVSPALYYNIHAFFA